MFQERVKSIFFSEDWKYLNSININLSGLASQATRVERIKHRIFIPVTGSPRVPEEKILELDLKNGNTKYYQVGLFPVSTRYYNDNLYTINNTSPARGTLTKLNLKSSKLEKIVPTKGVTRCLYVSPKYIYIAGDLVLEGRGQVISIYDHDLNLVKSIENSLTRFPSDMSLDGNKLMLANISKAKTDEPSDGLTELDLESMTFRIKKSLPSPNQILEYKNLLIVTHFYFPDRLNSISSITIQDKNLDRSSYFTYSLKNYAFKSLVSDNKLFVLGSRIGEDMPPKSIYVYDLNKKVLLRSVRLPQKNPMVVSGFFAM